MDANRQIRLCQSSVQRRLHHSHLYVDSVGRYRHYSGSRGMYWCCAGTQMLSTFCKFYFKVEGFGLRAITLVSERNVLLEHVLIIVVAIWDGP